MFDSRGGFLSDLLHAFNKLLRTLHFGFSTEVGAFVWMIPHIQVEGRVTSGGVDFIIV
jgi:hypothetical protein